MLDQAEQLRKLVKKSKKNYETNNQKRPVILTITSGKGGVGKSNFVVNTAICLQKMNKKVLIFDADIGMGNDDVLMGFLPKYSVYDIIFKGKNIEDVVIEGPFGIKLLPGGTGISKLNEITEEQRDNFIKMLSKLEDIDYIIMDTGAGINKSVLGFITCCDYLFVVTTPEPTAITDAYSLIKVVDYFKIKNSASIIINKVFDNIEGEKVFNKFNAAVNRFLSINLNYLGCISEDRKLVQAVKNQVPVVINFPSSAASEDIRNIVQKLLGVKSIKKDSGIQQLFKRIFDIFS
ncbi:MinD/ParA family protein [Clostridium tyrobutyricum]|uniref:MinD/ParA family protein n=1 Tax=Clostridium tyrobutyricum TaxID=1519 RepID=UPI0018AA245B|nr:MinD/ParA family protein [Clostridium tyrobutyricum]MBV4424050.1 P-loop NTPase [Clostridium tyrobutyricum]